MKTRLTVLCGLCDSFTEEGGTCSCKHVAFKDNIVYCDDNSFSVCRVWEAEDGQIKKFKEIRSTVWELK